MTNRNPHTSVRTLAACALVAALAIGVTCASANALDDSFEPLADVAAAEADGLDRSEAIAAARTFLGLPEACVRKAKANLVRYADGTCWKVKVTEAAGDGVDWFVLLGVHDDTVLNWWHE